MNGKGDAPPAATTSLPALDSIVSAHGREHGAGEEQAGGTIPTNLRLLLILERVARAGTPVTPTAVNVEMGLPKPTIHRLFSTLEEEGFLQREIDGRSFSPGRRMNRLAVETVSAVRVRGARLSVMTSLAAKVGETCNLAIPDRDAMVYLDRVETEWPLRIQLPPGTRVPLHCTASGKLYLSSLDDARLERFLRNTDLAARTSRTLTRPNALREAVMAIREAGYATDNEEFMEGMVAMAAPIHDRQGHLFATLSFHAPSQRMTIEDAVRHLKVLQGAADELALIVTAGEGD